MAEFRFEAIAPDGAEVRDTIEAVDHESAENALRGQGLCVYRLRSAGAPLRGPHVGPDEHVELSELPKGLVVRENIDGSITVTKTGLRRWGSAYVWLVALGWVAVGWVLVFFFARNDPAHRFAGTVLGLLVFAALVACTLWALFARDEWHVGEGFFESRLSLFGMDWSHTFRHGVFRIDQRTLRGPVAHARYRVSVLDHARSRALCVEYYDSAARTLAALLAQRTGWVLDDQIRDWSWLENAYPSTLLRWWQKLRGQR